MSSSIASELGLTWNEVWLTVITAAGVYLLIIALSRAFGQRQFASSSTYDLAFTFALGSLVGRVILVRTSLGGAVLGLVTMFLLHAGTGWLHHHVGLVHRAIQNPPILVVAHGEVLDDQLRAAKLSRVELYQALRLQGSVASLDQVQAAVLERSGEVSVISASERLDPELLAEVHGINRLTMTR